MLHHTSGYIKRTFKVCQTFLTLAKISYMNLHLADAFIQSVWFISSCIFQKSNHWPWCC